MFERFTDRARKVATLAHQEAQRLHHEYIGTEHLLLGLVMEGSGVGASVLKNLGVDLHKVRLEVEKLVQSGPETVTAGKLPYTPRTKKAIEYAMAEARSLNHNYVGTEHLLLGLLRERESAAAQVLMSLGIELEAVREEVLALLGAGTAPEPSDALGEAAATETPAADAGRKPTDPLAQLQAEKDQAVEAGEYERAARLRDEIKDWLESRRAIQTLQFSPAFRAFTQAAGAGAQARPGGAKGADSLDLLLALLADSGSPAAKLLREAGVTREAVEKRREVQE